MSKIKIVSPLYDKILEINQLGHSKIIVLCPINRFYYWYRKLQGDVILHPYEKLDEFKYKDGFLVLDSIHLISKNALVRLSPMLLENEFIGYSYIITERTKKEFEEILDISPEFDNIPELIEEYIIPDYKITIHKCSLDNTKKLEGLTEKERYDSYEELRQIDLELGNGTYMTEYKLLQILNQSYGKLDKINDLLREWKEDKVVIFNSTLVGINRLHCKLFSLYSNKKLIEGFNNNKIKHLAFNNFPEHKIKNVQKVIINIAHINPEIIANLMLECYNLEWSNSFGMLDLNIIISTECYEEYKIKQVLEMFESDKIKFK